MTFWPQWDQWQDSSQLLCSQDLLLNKENHTFSMCFSSYMSAPLYLLHQIAFSHLFFNNILQVCVLTEVSGAFSIGLPVLKSDSLRRNFYGDICNGLPGFTLCIFLWWYCQLLVLLHFTSVSCQTSAICCFICIK